MRQHDEAELRLALRRLQRTLDSWRRSGHQDLEPETADLLDDVDLRLRRLARTMPEDTAMAQGRGPARRGNGWGRNLYRDPGRAWLGGVCAGVARSLDVDRWLVRLVVVALALFNPLLTLMAYLAGMLLLARPSARAQTIAGDAAGSPGPRRVGDVATRFDTLEQRLRDMEGYVTSRQFRLRRELADLEGPR